MEQRKKVTKLVVSPSLAVPNAVASGGRTLHRELAGASSSLIVSDLISNLEAPIISESMEFDAVRNPFYKLCPLPDLLSLEHHAPDLFAAPPLSISSGNLFSVVDSSNKRFRSSPTPADSNPIPFSLPISRSRSTRSNEIGRQRRSKISDRVTILEGLMPWKCKMARGPMLEEAHKYIKFLEAQVTALQTMPVQSARSDDRGGRMKFGGLEMLNRQQMLQVMMNSSMVQDLIYKKGCCVFSEEQVALLRQKMAMAGSSSASN